MKVQLISFRKSMPWKLKRDLTIKLFNESKNDIILFCGHTIKNINDLSIVAKNISNKKPLGFLELKYIGARKITNWSFKIENGELVNMNSHQLFIKSSEIQGNEYLAEILFNEIQLRRLHLIKKKKICLLSCGELNILTNVQNDENRVLIRSEQRGIRSGLHRIFNSVDIFLNPIHTPMGNQGKMHKRREYLSAKGKLYFSTAQVLNRLSIDGSRSIQYAYSNGHQIRFISEEKSSNFLSRVYFIK